MMKEKLKNLIEALDSGLIERTPIIKLSLLALLAKENIVLIGKPGTAKSEISRRLSHALDSDRYFEYLLTKFSAPEEIFGPLSIQNLKQDIYHRKTEQFLPQAEIAFLDEVFKANSSILNALLTILNEGIFHNGTVKEQVPLLSVIGASNELPIGKEELQALFDRFLFRVNVEYISDYSVNGLINLKDSSFSIADELKLSKGDIDKIHEGTEEVTIPDEIRKKIINIRRLFNEIFADNRDEGLSDRRLRKLVKLLKVSAFTNDRLLVDESDLILVIHGLWSNPENIKTIEKIVLDNLTKKYKNKVKSSAYENHDDFVIVNKEKIEEGEYLKDDNCYIVDRNMIIEHGSTESNKSVAKIIVGSGIDPWEMIDGKKPMPVQDIPVFYRNLIKSTAIRPIPPGTILESDMFKVHAFHELSLDLVSRMLEEIEKINADKIYVAYADKEPGESLDLGDIYLIEKDKLYKKLDERAGTGTFSYIWQSICEDGPSVDSEDDLPLAISSLIGKKLKKGLSKQEIFYKFLEFEDDLKSEKGIGKSDESQSHPAIAENIWL